MNNISVFKNYVDFIDNQPIDQILVSIKEGKIKDDISNLRQLIAEQKTVEAEKLKKSLPAFTASGTFDRGRKAHLIQTYSQLIILDIDKINPDKLEPAFIKATLLPSTMACFNSPSGNGLKIIVKVSSTATRHEEAFNLLAAHYEDQLQLPIDRSGKDICRLCFFSYDPNLYYNPESQVFKVIVQQQQQPVVSDTLPISPHSQSDYALMYQKAVDFTRKKTEFVNGSRNIYVHSLACNCNRNGIPEAEAMSLILHDFNFNDNEVRSCIRSAYSKNKHEFGKFAQVAQVAQSTKIEFDKDEELSEQLFNTPYISNETYNKIPLLLQKACAKFKNPREKDIFLTGALSVLSGCMHGIYGVYDQRKVFPNLFSFIIAPAASGKGSLYFAKDLAMSYHQRLKDESIASKKQYQVDLEQYRFDKKNARNDDTIPTPDYPEKPKFKILFIPANSSAAAVIGHLEQSDGSGIIFETEADTMGNSFKQDWGGYSDLLRKAFQHEPVTYSRKANDEFIEVQNPCVSVALSGTPSQVQGLIASAEDGLFSRFIFYAFKVKSQWRDVSPQNKINLTDYFANLSSEVENMADFLQLYPSEILLSDKQWQFLNINFELWLKEVSAFISEEVGSTVKRLGLIVFRIAMVLTALRKFDNCDISSHIVCDDVDFETAFNLAEVYKHHAIQMYSILPKSEGNKLPQNKRVFYDALPINKEFTHQDAVKIGSSIGIKERTVGKYLKQLLDGFLVQPIKYGPYLKKG
ncbi:MAG: DUF3987 domain-containing protein [Bacteroidales bacterium]|nr:DUF3987 domain-containing protein [Bacteroidales bacterium]